MSKTKKLKKLIKKYEMLLENYQDAVDTINHLHYKLHEAQMEADDYCRAYEQVSSELYG